MTDIAQLAVEVQTGDVSRARRELNGFVADGRRAEQATQQLTAASGGLTRATTALVAALSARQVVAYADGYESVNARLRLVTSSAANFAQIQGQLIQQAESTRSSLTETVDLYSRIARSTRELNATDAQRLQVTANINKALAVSGASGVSAQAALVQLGQALGSGVLRGAELNSVLEQAPRIAEAIADGLGVSVNRLKELGEAGQLTSAQVFRALLSQTENLEREFKQVPVTIGQALTVAENRLQIFIGETSRASGAGRALSETIIFLAKNIDALAAAAIGFGTAKLAAAIAAVGVAARQRIADLVADAAAQRANLAATVQLTAARVAEAQAQAAGNATKLAGLQATNAAIVAARAEVAAKLQSAQAQIAASQSQIAAARSAGALSFALAAVREGENALAAAQARRAALTTELAVLGTQQARVQAAATAANVAQTASAGALAAATTAQTAAQRALTAAQTAGAGAGALASRALGLLGGPIGAVTTLLGLGATAWLLWGSNAETAEGKASGAIDKSTGDIIADLDAQIKKLKERNQLLRADPASAGAAGEGEAGQRLAQLNARITELRDKTTDFARGLAEPVRSELLRVLLTQYGELGGRIAAVKAQQDSLAEPGNADKVSQFLRKYATDAERVKFALEDAKKELGAAFTPEIAQRIEASFAKKGDANPYADEIAALRERAALLGLDTELERVNAEIKLGKYGPLSSAQQEELRRLAAIADARQASVDSLKAEEIARDAATAALTKAAQARNGELESLEEGNKRLREEIELIGADEAARTVVEQARIRSIRTIKEESLARQEAQGVAESQLQVLQAEINALKEREQLLGDRLGATLRAKTADTMRQAGTDTRNALADSIEQGILDGSRRGLDIMEIFKRELIAQFAKTVLRPIISPVAEAGNQLLGALVSAIGGSLGGLFNRAPGVTAPVYSPSVPVSGTPLPPLLTVPQAATGTNRVPDDGLYYLHKDEAVQPAKYNPAVGGAGGGATVVNRVIINEAPPGTTVTERPNGQGGTDFEVRLRRAADAAVAQSFASGGPAARSLEANYGVRRSTPARR